MLHFGALEAGYMTQSLPFGSEYFDFPLLVLKGIDFTTGNIVSFFLFRGLKQMEEMGGLSFFEGCPFWGWFKKKPKGIPLWAFVTFWVWTIFVLHKKIGLFLASPLKK